PEEQVKLVAQPCPHHLRSVGGDRERDLGLDESTDGAAQLFLARERLREQVRSRADLEHDAATGELAHQLWRTGCQDPVPDPVGPKRLDDLGDLLDALVAALLADVDRHAEPSRARLLDERGELAVRVAATSRTRAGDVHADDPARCPTDRLLDD